MLQRHLPLSRTRGPSRRYSFVASSLGSGNVSGSAAAAEDASPLSSMSTPPGLATTPLSLSPVRLPVRRSLSMASLLRPMEDASSRELLQQVISHVSLPPPQLAAIARSMASSMATGLLDGGGVGGGAVEGGIGSCVASGVPLMLPTATDCLPDGHERGEYFALEFGGGPTMRLLRVLFDDDRRHETSSVDLEEAVVPVDRLRHAPAEELFDFLAERALDFVDRVGGRSPSSPPPSSPPSPSSPPARSPPTFGFCFSFPIDQSAHPSDPSSGTLVRWAKGWRCPGGVGCEPARMLEAAARRVSASRREKERGGETTTATTAGRDDVASALPPPPPLVVAALANDTVATLAAARYSDGGDAALSLVLNRGTNAAYVESLSNVDRLCAAEALRARGWAPRSPEVVVDVEWPAFDDALLPALPDDVAGNGASESEGSDGEPHEDSIRASSRVFESLTAPMCLGESARRLLVRLGDAGGWFSDADGGGGRGDGRGGRGDDGATRASGRTGGGGVAPPPPPPPLWRVRGSLDAVAVARVASDASPDARYAAEELASAFCRGDPSSSSFLRFLERDRDARVQCRDACLALLRRSARLTAAGLAGVLIHREETGAARAPGGSAPSSPLRDPAGSPSGPSSPLPPAPLRRTVVAVDGPFFRRGGIFVDELRTALSETLAAALSCSGSPPPLVSLTVPEGGAALGAAALAAAGDNAARAMGAQDLGPTTTEGRFLKFPPRRGAASTPRPPKR